MKTPNVEVRKMNPFGVKYEQFYTKAAAGYLSSWNCHTGEWKKGFVRLVEDHDGYQKTYRVIVGDRELVGQECWICAKDKKRWQSELEGAGFEVRYEKKTKRA